MVSWHDGGAAYGGTPSDAAVLAAIADLKARGIKVTLYPLVMMDVPEDNILPDPYGGARQASYPWRGRITCHPAPGRPGTPDRTLAATGQVGDFAERYRHMVLHYAAIAADTEIDTVVIGSEMRGLTTVRGPGNTFPFVAALIDLAAEVRSIVGPDIRVTYAADWSEYSGYQPPGEKFFHLDPLWASPAIDAIGIDCYMPAADWRDGETHADMHAGYGSHDLGYLGANIAAGEGFDWYYADDDARLAQDRSAITDGAHGEPWIWRYKDLHAFWSRPHHDRPGGVRQGAPTAWIPSSKPIWLTELGCAAVDKGANQPNIFGDPKSAEGGRPYYSSGVPDLLMQRQFLRAHLRHWRDPNLNPPGMLDADRIYLWTWDARPYPAFPARDDVWSDGPNHLSGHWLTGRLGAVGSDELLSAIAAEQGAEIVSGATAPLIGGLVLPSPAPLRDAVELVLDVTGQRLLARNGAIVAQPQARGPGVTLDADLLAQLEGPTLSRKRPAAAERPSRLALTHIDRTRDYATASATALRPGQGPMLAESVDMVLDGTGARLAAERLLDSRASSDETLELAVPPQLVGLEPGDMIAVPGLENGPFEIIAIRDGAVRKIQARAMPIGDAVATGSDRPAMRPSEPMPAVPPLVVAAHVPDGVGSSIVIGAYVQPWPGPVRVTDDVTGATLAELRRPATIGTVTSAIGPGPAAVWDRGNVLEVTLQGGHLAAADELAVLGGSNRIAVETDTGNWEVIGFASAELLAPGEYRLSNLLRGQRHTEASIGPVSPGRRALLLNAATSALAVADHQLGEERQLRLYAGGNDLDGQSLSLQPAAFQALPLAPVHLRLRREANGDLTLSWTRRSRADGEGWSNAEPPLDHLPERYSLTIPGGSPGPRIIETELARVTYSLASQIADFGGPASGFVIEIAQLSAALGPGHLLTRSIHD